MSTSLEPRLAEFARRNHLEGLTASSLQALVEHRGGYGVDKAQRFLRFQQRIDRELLTHPVITANRYAVWFSRGEQSLPQVKAFVVQFSVFSNLFLLAQLHKVINADSVEGMRASKEILANEIGVIFNRGAAPVQRAANDDTDPTLVATEGTVEGGTFRFRAAHFEWLMRIAARLGLEFDDIGKRRHGTEATLHFCDELVRLYGSPDYAVSQAASYAVENWAAAGFWDQLVQGLRRFNERQGLALPLAFFTWHSRLEAQHARHTQEELEEIYFQRAVDEDAFLRVGAEMLDGVAVFWDGLDAQRKAIAHAA
jgi:pyrroloquinoline quinone (PQQ) biosynthesis protein C